MTSRLRLPAPILPFPILTFTKHPARLLRRSVNSRLTALSVTSGPAPGMRVPARHVLPRFVSSSSFPNICSEQRLFAHTEGRGGRSEEEVNRIALIPPLILVTSVFSIHAITSHSMYSKTGHARVIATSMRYPTTTMIAQVLHLHRMIMISNHNLFSIICDKHPREFTETVNRDLCCVYAL